VKEPTRCRGEGLPRSSSWARISRVDGGCLPAAETRVGEMGEKMRTETWG
jgi:hypothetical protein